MNLEEFVAQQKEALDEFRALVENAIVTGDPDYAGWPEEGPIELKEWLEQFAAHLEITGRLPTILAIEARPIDA